MSDVVCEIYRLHGDKEEQGQHVARVEISNYKWAPKNAFVNWVRDTSPEEGKYLVTGMHSGKHVASVFTLKYASFTVQSNGHEEVYGGSHGWGAYEAPARRTMQYIKGGPVASTT